MTYADGTVVAGFMKNNPEIEYPEPDDDHFYVAEVYANTSFALGGAPLYAVGKDVVTLAVYDNFDNARTWSVNLYTTLTAGARLTAVKLVSLVGSTPVTVLDLGSAIDFASPDIADFGFLNENGEQGYPTSPLDTHDQLDADDPHPALQRSPLPSCTRVWPPPSCRQWQRCE
jgi:hypothetical protein